MSVDYDVIFHQLPIIHDMNVRMHNIWKVGEVLMSWGDNVYKTYV